MIQNITKHIPLTTMIITYFFICGGLYLIGFWTTFNIDISNIVNIADIPKSFIYPFVLSQGFYLFNTLTNMTITDNRIDSYEPNPYQQQKTKMKRFLFFLVSIDFLIILSSFFIFIFHLRFEMSPSYWMLSTIVLALLLFIKFQNNSSIKKLIPYASLRIYIVNTIIFVPFLCFGTGKSNSLKIYNNNESKHVKIIKDTIQTEKIDSSYIKFIGFLGDKLIVSTIDNKKIIVINQSSFDNIQIEALK